jgi:cell wall assembly regulator SMI1
MDAADAVARLSATVDRLAAQGFDIRPLVVGSPASPSQVDEVENQLGCALPGSLRRVLTTVASRVEFNWYAPTDRTFPEPFDEIFAGHLVWSLEALPELMGAARGWMRYACPDREDPYQRVWYDKLPVMDVGNGDYVALDLDPDEHGRVVYVSHDGGEGHGHVMAASFEDLLIRWIPLACPGAVDVLWWPFRAESDGRIDPSSETARQWIALLGLDVGSGTGDAS